MKFLFVVEPLSYEWLGIMYVSAVLKKHGVETKLYIVGEPIENIISYNPDFIGYSLLTGSHKNLITFNRNLKKKLKFKSVFGGPHATYFPSFSDEENVDYVIRGEAEEAIIGLIDDTLKDKVTLSQLPIDLDLIPFPDRSLVYDKLPSEKNNPIKHFIASRGCPFDCPYCYNNPAKKLFEGKKWVRYRTPTNIINEIKEVKSKYPTKFIYFQDDCFVLNKKWLEELLFIYKQEVNLPFHCIVRLDLLDDKTVKILKDAGCMCVRCAVESGNDYIRNTILKRNMTKEQIINGAKMLTKYDIKYVMQNILGLPKSTLKTDIETLRLNMKCKPTLAWSSIFQPYPGTELAKYYPNIKLDNISNNFYNTSPIEIPDKNKIEKLQKLFGIINRFPFLYPLLFILLRLPLNFVYLVLWKNNNKFADKKLYGGVI